MKEKMNGRSMLFRRLICILAMLMLVCVGAAVLAACGGSDDEGGDPPAASISLNKTSVTLEAGKTELLIATLQNSEETIIWTSEDNSVATVDNDGLVHAVAKGETSVTATAGTVWASCTVTVVDETAPVISVDYKELNIVRGKSFTVTATTTFNGALESAVYDWQCDDEDDIISISAEGDKATLTALKVGRTEVAVSTTAHGVFVSTKLTVNVLPIDVAFDISNIDKVQNRYELMLIVDHDLTPALTVTEDGEVVPGAVVAWSVYSGDNVVNVDPSTGKIDAVSTGEAVVKGTYTTTTNEEASVYIYVTVKGEERNLAKTTLNLDIGTDGNTTADITVDLEQSGLSKADLKRVTLDGAELDITDMTVSGNSLSIPAALFNKGYGDNKEMVAYFSKYEFHIPVRLVSKIINNETDFLAIKEISEALNGGGYFLLGGNISVPTRIASGSWGSSGFVYDADDYRIALNTPFKGVIDGDGHTVTNLTLIAANSGWIQNMASGSVLKNIAFKDFAIGDSAALIYGGNTQGATFENIYISVKTYNLRGGVHTSVFGVDYLTGCTFKNVVVDYLADARTTMDSNAPEHKDNMTGSDRYYKAFGMPNNCTMENVALLNMSTVWRNNVVRHANDCDNGADDHIFVTYADGSNNGYTVPSGWSETLLGFLPARGNAFASTENVTISSSGDAYSLSGASPYWTYALSSEAIAAGITFENGTITFPANTASGNYRLIATALFDEAQETLTFVVMGGQTVTLGEQTIKLQLSASGGALQASGNFTLSLTGAGSNLGTVIGISVGSKALSSLSGVTLSGTTLTIPMQAFTDAKPYGRNSVSVKTQQGNMLYTFEFEALFISLEATSPTEFLSFAAISRLHPNENNNAFGGYFTLGNNITLDTTTDFGASAEYRLGWSTATNARVPFIGTIDGQGHTVSNMTVATGACGWIEIMGSGSVLKNIAIENFRNGQNCALTYGSNAVGGATFENVYVKMGNTRATNALWAHASVIGSSDLVRGATLKNVVVDYSLASWFTKNDGNDYITNQKAFGRFSSDCTFTNVAVIGLGKDVSERVLMMDGVRGDGSAQGVYVGYIDGTNNGVAVPTDWSTMPTSILLCGTPSFSFTPAEATGAASTAWSHTVSNLSPYWSYSLSAEAIAQGITFTGGKINVPETAASGNYFFTATPIFGGHNTQSFKIIVKNTTVVSMAQQKVDLGLSVNGGALQTKSGSFTVTLTGTGPEGAGAVHSISLGGSTINGATLNGTTLSIPYSELKSLYGLNKTIVMTEQGNTAYTFNFDLLIVSLEATTKDQFLSFAAISRLLNYGGYFTLGNNIPLDAATDFGASAEYRLGWNTSTNARVPFIGTIDGQGYTVSDMTVATGACGWIDIMGEGSVLKNIAIENFRNGQSSSLTYGSKNYGGATIENVYVKMANTRGQALWQHASVFGSDEPVGNATLKNVIVDYSAASSWYTRNTGNGYNVDQKALGRFTSDGTLTNVAVIGLHSGFNPQNQTDNPDTGRVLFMDGVRGDGSAEGVYVGYTDGTTNGVTFPASGWDSDYWTVSGTTVTWKGRA